MNLVTWSCCLQSTSCSPGWRLVSLQVEELYCVPTLGQPPSAWCTLALLKVTGWELQSPVNTVGVNWVLLPSWLHYLSTGLYDVVNIIFLNVLTYPSFLFGNNLCPLRGLTPSLCIPHSHHRNVQLWISVLDRHFFVGKGINLLSQAWCWVTIEASVSTLVVLLSGLSAGPGWAGAAAAAAWSPSPASSPASPCQTPRCSGRCSASCYVMLHFTSCHVMTCHVMTYATLV